MTAVLYAFPGINDKFFKLNLVLQLLVNGLSNGALYALMAVTVVIIYRTTSHLNFAQGEMAMVSSFLVWTLWTNKGWPIWLAIAIVVPISMVGGAVVERTLIRPAERRSALAPVIVSLGLFFVINAFAAWHWGTENKNPNLRPFNDHTRYVLINGVPKFIVKFSALGIWLTVAVVVAALTFMLQRTKLGLAYRAVASNRESAQLVGIPVGRMLSFGWALAAGIGALAGVMTSQWTSSLSFGLMGGVLIYGLAAATLGGLDSLKGAIVGGIIVGVAEAILPQLFSFLGTELNLVVALLVIVVVLAFRPQGLFGTKRVERV